MVESKEMDRTAQYICTLSPLLDFHMPENSSYILAVEFLPHVTTNTTVNNDSYDSVSPDSAEYFAFFENDATIKTRMVLLVSSRDYRRALFFLRCSCLPFVLAAAVYFGYKIYCNDLYIAIPDRADCVDRSEEVQPASTYTPGTPHEMMVLRVCAKFDPIFRSSALVAGFQKDGAGDYALVSTNAYVQEP